MLISTCLFLVAQIGASTSTSPKLDLVLRLSPTVLDYELPGHPHMLGRGHVGLLARAGFHYQPNPYVKIGAGILGRVPFALQNEDYADAIATLFIEGHPLGNDDLIMRFGSLKTDHGYHSAVVDEARFSISRNVLETYNRSLPEEAHRTSLPRNAMPAEHGAQVIYQRDNLKAELFLDWQLLETDTHREKFNFGAIAQFNSRWADLGAQFRLTHYGGQIFTQGDPIRFAQLDPVRQPETFALTLNIHAIQFENLALNVLANAVTGHLRQSVGGEEKWHYGFEGGLESIWYDHLKFSYRYWWPKNGKAGFLSEDSEPSYNQGITHRVEIGLLQTMGGLLIDGRLAIIFPEDAPDKVQYLAITQVSYDFIHKIF